MDCKGCFYKRTDNNFNDFRGSRNLAEDMQSNGYRLETCYLLPTDIFDNKDNYSLFDNEDFAKTISQFAYLGIASTLEDGFDTRFFDIVYGLNDDIKIEYKDRVVINLAINTGFSLDPKEKDKIKSMLKYLSEDGIVELNFTFLYNKDISEEKKQKMMKDSIRIIQDFGDFYQKDESFVTKYNQRTFLRKPSFVFVGEPNTIYVNPIVPFDEYVYIKKDRYVVQTPTYDGFLNSYGKITEINTPVVDACESCENLTHCMGKFYFAISNDFDLGCFLNLKE